MYDIIVLSSIDIIVRWNGKPTRRLSGREIKRKIILIIGRYLSTEIHSIPQKGKTS